MVSKHEEKLYRLRSNMTKFITNENISISDAENIILENIRYSNYDTMNQLKEHNIYPNRKILVEIYN